MTWTKLGDDFADRLEDLELTPTACWLHTVALVYCNRRLTDGRFPHSQLGRVSTIAAPDLYAAELEQAGVWTEIEGEDAWQLDWSDQESAEIVKLRQKNQAEKQARYRKRVAMHAAGDHVLCSADRCTALRKSVTGNATGDKTRAVTGNETGHVTHSRPDPTRPAPKGAGKGRRCPRNAIVAEDGRCCPECAAERDAIAPPLTEAAS